MASAGSWPVVERRGSAGHLHALVPDEPVAAAVWRLVPDGPAVVLGSTQPDDVVDHERARSLGVEVARRRSGGGAVWLDPDVVWIDVILPRDHPAWVDDVGRAARWMGRAWAQVAAHLGIEGTEVHDGPMEHTPWSAAVCFAGRGPGEVFVGERKLVGISQRRTRTWARFQCAIHRHWDPRALLAVLAPPAGLDPGALERAGVGISDAGGAGDVAGARIADVLVEVLTSRRTTA